MQKVRLLLSLWCPDDIPLYQSTCLPPFITLSPHPTSSLHLVSELIDFLHNSSNFLSPKSQSFTLFSLAVMSSCFNILGRTFPSTLQLILFTFLPRVLQDWTFYLSFDLYQFSLRALHTHLLHLVRELKRWSGGSAYEHTSTLQLHLPNCLDCKADNALADDQPCSENSTRSTSTYEETKHLKPPYVPSCQAYLHWLRHWFTCLCYSLGNWGMCQEENEWLIKEWVG